MKKRWCILAFLTLVVTMFSRCRKPEDFPADAFDDRLSGGINTAFDISSGAFSHEFPGLTSHDLSVHEAGDVAFEQTFVTAPAPVNSGLGPAFNNVSCRSCHHNDGSGMPTTGDVRSAMLLRISLPGSGPHLSPLPVPGYGAQLQDRAIAGKKPECKINITYTDQQFSFPDGQTYSLRTPQYTLGDLHEPINGPYELSPRLAPVVFGLGLLEAIPESTLIALSDETDSNGDGISGKMNVVWDPASGSLKPGRFGLKANTASILTQVAGAYHQDMGVTNPVFPDESTFGQQQYDNLQDDVELPDSTLQAVKFYIQTLSVPARRNVDHPLVLQGKNIFMNARCNSCHIPVVYTDVNVAFPPLSNQRIQPFTDLLLHDMGDGLADNRADFRATGREWRTTPLWGLGLKSSVNVPAYYLHDGRARSILEAIMWHDGEAKSSKDYVEQLSTSDREALLKFLESL